MVRSRSASERSQVVALGAQEVAALLELAQLVDRGDVDLAEPLQALAQRLDARALLVRVALGRRPARPPARSLSYFSRIASTRCSARRRTSEWATSAWLCSPRR